MRRRARRKSLSMTSLIDVIFLLLLFFMLTSTFSKFSEIELTSGAAGGQSIAQDAPPKFLRLGNESIDINGTPVALTEIGKTMTDTENPAIIIKLQDGVSAQRLTDLLVELRRIKGAKVTVLEG